LPHPGRWMLWLRRALSLLLLGTALWLLYVLLAQVGPAASLLSAGALGMVLLLLALRRLAPRARRAGLAAAALIALLAPAVVARTPEPMAAGSRHWRKFDEHDLQRLIGEGHVVLVDVTADWCINCQVNKALVLERGWAADQLASGRIIALKADWTNPDPLIARYLASFGRYGIPFDAIYGP